MGQKVAPKSPRRASRAKEKAGRYPAEAERRESRRSGRDRGWFGGRLAWGPGGWKFRRRLRVCSGRDAEHWDLSESEASEKERSRKGPTSSRRGKAGRPASVGGYKRAYFEYLERPASSSNSRQQLQDGERCRRGKTKKDGVEKLRIALTEILVGKNDKDLNRGGGDRRGRGKKKRKRKKKKRRRVLKDGVIVSSSSSYSDSEAEDPIEEKEGSESDLEAPLRKKT